MFKETFKSTTQTELEAITKLERNGFTDAAKFLVVDLVRREPNCKACRIHMGKMFAKEETENVKNHKT